MARTRWKDRQRADKAFARRRGRTYKARKPKAGAPYGFKADGTPRRNAAPYSRNPRPAKGRTVISTGDIVPVSALTDLQVERVDNLNTVVRVDRKLLSDLMFRGLANLIDHGLGGNRNVDLTVYDEAELFLSLKRAAVSGVETVTLQLTSKEDAIDHSQPA